LRPREENQGAARRYLVNLTRKDTLGTVNLENRWLCVCVPASKIRAIERGLIKEPQANKLRSKERFTGEPAKLEDVEWENINEYRTQR
jgi:hypothetical protein